MKTLENILLELRDQGYSIVEDVFSTEECESIGLHLDSLENSEGMQGCSSHTQKRQFQILNVHYADPSFFLKYIDTPEIIKVVESVLNDKVILSNFNASRSLKSDLNDYRIHIDSRKPNPSYENTYQIVANICVDDFTLQNGATVVVPKSHLSGVDPRNTSVQKSSLVSAVAPKGSVVFMLGQTWHDIGNNQCGSRRWSIIAYYSCWWIKPTYDFIGSCTQEIYGLATSSQRSLLGFNSRPPADWSIRQKTITDIEQLSDDLSVALSTK